MAGKSVFLEVDTSLRDRNLILQDPQEDEEFNRLLNSAGQLPPIAIQPRPGFCVKSHQCNGKKIFINFCHSEKIPAPKEVTAERILEMMYSDEDANVNYRVPMSIGELRTDHDKKGEEVCVVDVAVNPNFMQKCLDDHTFKEYLIYLGFGGCQQKYGVETVPERIVLKNKKVMGTINNQFVQQRVADKQMEFGEKLPKLDAIMKENPQAAMSDKIQVLNEVTKTPLYRLFRKKSDSTSLYGEFYLPYVTSAKDISMDIGQDRLILETTNGKYFLDVFHEFNVIREQSCCEYNLATKFLTVTMPIKQE